MTAPAHLVCGQFVRGWLRPVSFFRRSPDSGYLPAVAGSGAMPGATQPVPPSPEESREMRGHPAHLRSHQWQTHRHTKADQRDWFDRPVPARAHASMPDDPALHRQHHSIFHAGVMSARRMPDPDTAPARPPHQRDLRASKRWTSLVLARSSPGRIGAGRGSGDVQRRSPTTCGQRDQRQELMRPYNNQKLRILCILPRIGQPRMVATQRCRIVMLLVPGKSRRVAWPIE